MPCPGRHRGVFEAAWNGKLPFPTAAESFRSPSKKQETIEPGAIPCQQTFLKDLPKFGSRHQRLRDCRNFFGADPAEIEVVLGQDYTLLLTTETSRQQFEASFNRLAMRESSRKPMIVLPGECEWEYPWVEHASHGLGQFRNKNVVVVFLGHPARVWKRPHEWKVIAKEPGLSANPSKSFYLYQRSSPNRRESS